MLGAMIGSFGMAGSLISVDATRAGTDIVAKVLSDEQSRARLETILSNARDFAVGVVEQNSYVVEALREATYRRCWLSVRVLRAVERPLGLAPEPGRAASQARTTGADQSGTPVKRATGSGNRHCSGTVARLAK